MFLLNEISGMGIDVKKFKSRGANRGLYLFLVNWQEEQVQRPEEERLSSLAPGWGHPGEPEAQ
jgi:hypothetical protein